MSGTTTQTTTTTVIPFTPTSTQAFQFGATLDGVAYTCTVTWNLSGQRWYLNIYTNQAVLVLSRALTASPPGVPYNLLFGYFLTTVMVFWDVTQTFQVTP
jgi:hypothetical protein